MKKKIAFFMAAGMLFTAACSDTHEISQIETSAEMTAAPTAQSEEAAGEGSAVEESATEQEKQSPASSDVDSQINIIAQNYDRIIEECFYSGEIYPGTAFAVTDLNRDGRLELLVTSMQGTGAFSLTYFFEISEDYSSLEGLMTNLSEPVDGIGDFLMNKIPETDIAVYDCYMKDGQYYYLVENYGSGGWDFKQLAYYSYSIGDGVTRDYLGGCEIEAKLDEDQNTIKNAWLHGPDDILFESYEEYSAYLNSYWSDYEKQPSCEVRWMDFDSDFAGALAESYNAFKTDSEAESSVTYDYRSFFGSFYGDEDFIIKTNPYEVFLEDYKKAVQEPVDTWYYGPDNDYGDDVPEGTVGLITQGLSDRSAYALYDIDGDGVSEFFLGGPWDDEVQLTGVVTMHGADYKVVFSAWSRRFVKYLGEGYFYAAGSSGAFEHVVGLYKYNGKTKCMDLICQLLTKNEDENGADYFYYEGTGGENRTDVLYTGEEASAAFDKQYEALQGLNNELLNVEWTEFNYKE